MSEKRYRVFCDESGTHSDSRCYGIGALCLSEQEMAQVTDFAASTKASFHLDEELKWSRINKFNASIKAAVEVIDHVLESRLSFHIIVVKKNVYREWTKNTEEAFYKTYYQLITHLAERIGEAEYAVVIDNRSDSYGKQDEVLQITANHYLARQGDRARIEYVKKGDSHLVLCLQCVDILTGAVTASTNHYLDPDYILSPGKAGIVKHFANRLGWASLAYDTYPNPSFNIWHFPVEFRRVPGSKQFQGVLGRPDP